MLLGYNLVRQGGQPAAVAHQRAPNEVSFKFACQFIANQMAVMAARYRQPIRQWRLAELQGCIGVMFIEKTPQAIETQGGVEDIKDPFPVNRNAAPEGALPHMRAFSFSGDGSADGAHQGGVDGDH